MKGEDLDLPTRQASSQGKHIVLQMGGWLVRGSRAPLGEEGQQREKGPTIPPYRVHLSRG